MPQKNTPGQPPAPGTLTDIPRLVTAFYAAHPDPANPAQKVAFGTSGHRGSSLNSTFNYAHIIAITQAICEHRAAQKITGPLFLAKDTHALSEPAFASALEVLAANSVNVILDQDLGYTPTPVLSHAILTYNAENPKTLSDGIVITPSHNPPEDGGFKYNPPNGGPADTAVTKWIEERANAIIAGRLKDVRRVPYAEALAASGTHRHDYITHYVDDLANVIDFDVLRNTKLELAVDPLGGAGVAYWPRIAEKYALPLEILNTTVDPTFRFMTVDWDGRIRMDCSSPYAMASMIANKDKFDVAWACDTDHDRHGIVTRSAGLLNPNHYLAVAIEYLFTHRGWDAKVGIGKTLVSSSMIDRVARGLNRPMLEVPVGFKWFVDGLVAGTLGFAGEESAGASFLRRNGAVWTTDKDGLIMGLLAAEMTARTGKDPGQLYRALTEKYGDPVYQRIDAAATKEQKSKLGKLSPSQVTTKELAGEPITAILTEAPGNKASIGGLKVTTENGWFAARPSGTEDVYKIYAESFKGEAHLKQIQTEAKELVTAAIKMNDIYKFGAVTDIERAFSYENVWAIEKTLGPNRLIIAPNKEQIEVFRSLLKVLQGPFWILYVLVVPRGEAEAGRYQCEEPVTFETVERFLLEHREYLEDDGRMNLWVATASGSATLVYDRHNVIYAYGPLETFQRALNDLGLSKTDSIRFPDPHAHHYHERFDVEASRIIKDQSWIYSPLKDSDVTG